MLRVLVVLLCAAAFGTSANAGKRVALVVGNSAYETAVKLGNPANDAADLAVALKAHGFIVIDGLDLNKAGFDRKVRDFSAALAGAEAGLFFYAGHGLQIADQNYLVPVDARLDSPNALEVELVSVDTVQRAMQGLASTRIIFLDACRNNPLAGELVRSLGARSTEANRSTEVKTGLAPIEGSAGTLISFSTQPGNVALDGKSRNSPFTAALVRHISTPHEDLAAMLLAVRRDVMNATNNEQIPWEHSALTRKFFFDAEARAASEESRRYWPGLSNGQTVSTITPDGRPLTCVGGNNAQGMSRKCAYKSLERKQAIQAYEDWLQDRTTRLEATRGVNDYASAVGPKAFSMCIDWNSSKPGAYKAGPWAVAKATRPAETIAEVSRRALQSCVQRKTATNCECQVVHENGKRVADPPTDWLDRFAPQ